MTPARLHPDLITAVEKIAAAEKSRDWKAYERAKLELSRLCDNESSPLAQSQRQYVLVLQTYLGLTGL